MPAPTFAPFARPLYVMAKPSGSLCNLRCSYCYYLEKERLYADEQPTERYAMNDNTLEMFIRQYIEAQTQPQILFTWHGGEPLLRSISFYRRVIQLQQKYARGHVIDNCLQTNGTLITDEWARFFAANHWLIGISIDGPQPLHDAYRLSQGGQPSFHRVMRGIRLLQKYHVEWNAMGVVNHLNAEHALDVYNFYKENGCQYIQFAPIVERLKLQCDGRHLATPADGIGEGTLASYSITPQQYAQFCCTIFDEWVRNDVAQVFVQLFDATLARWVGEEPGVCTMCQSCGHAAAIEHNGDLYSCDHFVFPQYKLGNIHQQTITQMMYSPQQQQFGRSKRTSLPRQCLSCQWLSICNGGCPKNRFCLSSDGEPGLNYLCEAFQTFFTHVAPYMDFMANELRHQRPPANVMQQANAIEVRQK